MMQEVRTRLATPLILVGVIWVAWFAEAMLPGNFRTWGILPRDIGGLPGIATAPFVHGSVRHLVGNSLPLIILGCLVNIYGRQFLRVTIITALVGGALTWLLARDAWHIGASGLVFGYFGYLMARAWFTRTIVAILIAIPAFLLYGGSIIAGMLPSLTSRMSFEGHIFGLIGGIVAARMLADNYRKISGPS